jgi:hypothetical protein
VADELAAATSGATRAPKISSAISGEMSFLIVLSFQIRG